MKPVWHETRRQCECGATFRYHRDLREHRATAKHWMPTTTPLNPSHRGPAHD